MYLANFNDTYMIPEFNDMGTIIIIIECLGKLMVLKLLV